MPSTKGVAHSKAHVEIVKVEEKKEREWGWWENEGGESEKLTKIKAAFANGCPDSEAILYADITERQLYYYQKICPAFVRIKSALKELPIIKARETIMKNLNDPKIAAWYLERKRKDEFSTKSILTTSIIDGRIPEDETEAINSILLGSGLKKLDESTIDKKGLIEGEVVEMDVSEEDTIL